MSQVIAKMSSLKEIRDRLTQDINLYENQGFFKNYLHEKGSLALSNGSLDEKKTLMERIAASMSKSGPKINLRFNTCSATKGRLRCSRSDKPIEKVKVSQRQRVSKGCSCSL